MKGPKINKLGESFGHAWSGLVVAWETQNNFRWHILALVLVLALAFGFKLAYFEWFFILLVSFLVIICELINTIIERLVDLSKPRVHVYAKMIKDLMAGITLLAAVLAVIIGGLIFLPKLFH